MDFSQNRNFRFNVILLKFIGQWPHQSPRFQRFHQIVFHLNVFSVMIVQIIKMLEMWGNVDIMIECITPVGVQIGATMKTINFIINRSKMKQLLEKMQKDWATLNGSKEISILDKFAGEGRQIGELCQMQLLRNVFLGFLFGSMAVYLLIPMLPQILNVVLPLNESRQLTALYETEYFIDPDKNYYYIALHTYIGTIITIFFVVSIDIMYAAYVYHACGLLAIVGDKLEKTRESIDTSTCDPDVAIESDPHYQELIECVKLHQDAIEFAVLVDTSFSKAFLFQIGLCMLLVSVSLLQLLTKLGNYEQMYRIIQFTLAQAFHLAFNSWPGQKLINQSTILGDSIYSAGWYGFSLRGRTLIHIMIGATKPLKITAFGLYDMSMENYGKLMQSSISYFTVFASLR